MHRWPIVAAGLVLLTLTAALAPARAGGPPLYPNQQQAALRDTEDEVLGVQRRLFAARQMHDEAAIEALGKQFKQLQDKRRQLIQATKDQLPSE